MRQVRWAKKLDEVVLDDATDVGRIKKVYFDDLDEALICFVTYREGKHFFRAFQGFGISRSVLDELKENKVHYIILKYKKKDGGLLFFFTTIFAWLNSDKYYNFDGDYQKFLSVKYMSENMVEVADNVAL